MNIPNFRYVFPACAVPEPSLIEQTRHILDEVEETQAEIVKDSPITELIAAEAMDIIHATETLLRQLPDEVVRKAWKGVIEKNAFRGYYGDKSEKFFGFISEDCPIDQMGTYADMAVKELDFDLNDFTCPSCGQEATFYFDKERSEVVFECKYCHSREERKLV